MGYTKLQEKLNNTPVRKSPKNVLQVSKYSIIKENNYNVKSSESGLLEITGKKKKGEQNANHVIRQDTKCMYNVT
jgi:hypothetical protein